LRSLEAPIIPIIQHPLDTRHFPDFPPEVKDELENEFPVFKGRRLRKIDIPFIGFTFKNLAAVPALMQQCPALKNE